MLFLLLLLLCGGLFIWWLNQEDTKEPVKIPGEKPEKENKPPPKKEEKEEPPKKPERKRKPVPPKNKRPRAQFKAGDWVALKCDLRSAGIILGQGTRIMNCRPWKVLSAFYSRYKKSWQYKLKLKRDHFSEDVPESKLVPLEMKNGYYVQRLAYGFGGYI